MLRMQEARDRVLEGESPEATVSKPKSFSPMHQSDGAWGRGGSDGWLWQTGT